MRKKNSSKNNKVMAGNPPNLPTENIDEVILRLLALEPNEVDELDYQTYKQYLKELLIEVDRGRKIGGDEAQLIRKEFKRVRAKTGRFKIKVKRIKLTSNNLGLGGIKNKVAASQKRLMIAPSGGIPKEKENVDSISSGGDNLYKILERINNSLDSIIGTLTDINNLNRSRIERERKNSETKKRTDKEKELESKIGGIKKAISTITKPFQSIWDRIVNFIKNVILGRIFIKLIEWIADPNNQGKIQSIIRFFKDWWPAILGGYVLFGTTFGKLIRSTVGIVGRFIFQIGKVAIPQLLKFINTPFGKATALFTAGATIPAMFPGSINEQERKTSQTSGTTADKIKQLQQQKANLNLFDRLQGKGSEIDEQISYLQTGKTKSYGFSGGAFTGLIKGPGGPKGDKIPALLSDGEFVVSAGAVQKYGVNTFEAMNAAGGGTNQPKVIGGTTYAAGGGYVGGKPQRYESEKDPVSSIKNFIKFKLGYDVDKPQTWGSSFSAGISSISGSGRSGSPSFGGGSEIKFGFPNVSGIGNNAQQLINSGLDPRTYRGLLSSGQNKLKDVMFGASRISSGVKDRIIGAVDTPLAALERYGTSREDALIKSGELKPGAALTKTTQANLDKSDAWIKSLYDPTKDKGPVGKVKQIYQDIQNKGLTPDLTAMMGLKSEGFEKFVEKASGGRVKNFGAKLTGLQYAVKGLMGPLGKAFRVDDGGSLGRYVKPAIMEAQKRGQGGVGAVGLGQKDYDRLMGDRLANLALGQFNFKVDKSGKATTDDTYEANKPASEYFKNARSNLKGGKIGPALFQAVSGVLRINQNTGWGNLRPGGSGIDLGGGFTPTDDKGKPLPPNKSKAPIKSTNSVTMYSSNDPRRKQSGSYKSKFARPKNSGVSPAKPPVKPSAKPSTTQYRGGQRSGRSNASNSQKPKSVNPTHPKGTRTAKSTLGINK